MRRAGSWIPYALVLLTVAASLGGLAVRPATTAPQQTLDYVIVAGAAGLRWDDLDPETTPTLWAEASKGSIGWLTVRSAARTTCPSDGWVTLGAGNYATYPRVDANRCEAPSPELTQPDEIGANVANQRNIVRDNQDKLPYGSVPGSLAESVRCTVAVGAGAAIAAARPFGRVDQYEAELPDDPTSLLSGCVLSIIDLGTISGSGAARQAAVAKADALLARVVAARPDRSLLLVAGVSDTDRGNRLHVAIAEGEGWNGGWLTSAGTGRDGYLQLIDLAPTVLAALGKSSPKVFAGRAATVVDGKPDSVADAVQGGHNADKRATAQRGVASIFFTVLAILEFLVFALVVPVMVRARRHSGPKGPALPSARVVAILELALIAVSLAIPAALLADASPWWRGDHPAWAFGLVTGALTVAGAAVVRAVPRYRHTLWPMAAVAAIGALIVGMDLLTGAQLQLNGVAGYSVTTGARYAGVGGVGLGVFVAGLLVLAGCLARWVGKRWRPVVVVLLGGVGVVMVGSPYLGADTVGAIAVTAGVCVSAAISTGGWLTFSRFAWAALAGLAVTIGFAVLDLRRPELEQGSLGRFLTELANGSAGPAVQRAAAANGETLVSSPITVLALVGILMLAFCRFSPWGGLSRLFGLHPAIRAAGAGTTVATLIAGLLGGSALTVAGAATAFAVPLAVLTALRVLLHAADRTRPEGETDGPGGPALRKSGEEHPAKII